MSYLARLMAQTGVSADLPQIVSAPVGLDVVGEEIEIRASPASELQDASPSAESLPIPTPEPPHDVPAPDRPVIEVPEPAVEFVERPHTEQVEEISVPSPAPTESSAKEEVPDVPADPREVLLRQVMTWVSSNEPPTAERTPSPVAEQHLAVETEPPVAEISDAAVPSLSIGPAPQAPKAPAEQTPDDRASASEMPLPPRPGVSMSETPVTPRRADTQSPHIVEETIELSIGAIHLDVTPPKTPERVVSVTQPPAQPLPARPGPSSSASRLARRFIRV